ncbi:11760_t:CDS:2, partial [Scutellospora calospora]
HIFSRAITLTFVDFSGFIKDIEKMILNNQTLLLEALYMWNKYVLEYYFMEYYNNAKK